MCITSETSHPFGGAACPLTDIGRIGPANRAGKKGKQVKKLPKKFADIEVTRVNNDINGNPRRVVHFLAFITKKDDEEFSKFGLFKLHDLYELARKRARKIGGRKFHNKQYGGGIVFQSYDDNELRKDIAQLMAKEEA